MNIELKNKDYQQLISQISDTFVLGQKRSVLAVNTHLIETYWKIGEYIVEYEQGGSGKAEYGKQLLERLSKDLSLLHGKGCPSRATTLTRKLLCCTITTAKKSLPLSSSSGFQIHRRHSQTCTKRTSHRKSYRHYSRALYS